MRLLLKNTLKKFKKSIGRFLSITLIIALGISIFIGLSESTAGILYTADNYFDKSNLMDFKVTSTYGLNDDDINSLRELKNVEKVIPTYSKDVVSNGTSIRIHAIENDANNVTLIKGNMPDNINECVADYAKYKLGDIISFEIESENNILLINQCNVVGTIKSALYVREDKGISSVGNGKLSSYIYVDKNAFNSDYYTEAYLISKNSQSKSSYYEDYNESIENLKNELKNLKPIRETIRYEEVLKEANDKITQIKNEIDIKLNDAKIKLDITKNKLDSGSKELEKTKTTTINQINSSRKTLNNTKKQIVNSLSTMGIEESEISVVLNSLIENIESLKQQLNTYPLDSEEYKSINEKIISLNINYKQLNSLQENLNEINSNLFLLDKNYESFIYNIKLKEQEIQKGYNEYSKGLEEYRQSEERANKDIEEAKQKVNDIKKPVWYLLDRSDNSGYISYKEDVVKVDAIAKILPYFFIIVAVLMILNTLTRLIEEERVEIGILQANGFSKNTIIISYLLYVCTAGLLGIGIGLTIGYSVIPSVIYSAFLSRYYVPKLITIVSPIPFSSVIIITLFLITLVTIVACRKELKEVPANLLRPKPPKAGKKVLIERINFIWSRFGFLWKTTIRNLFRYKKRVIMTVLGIAGCTALLVTGMGINDSVDNISNLQYKDIIKYDANYILKNEVSSIPDNIFQLYSDSGIVNPLLINQNVYTFSFNNKTEDVYLMSPSDIVSFNNYISLKSTISLKNVSISNQGAIITKQMADHLNVKPGDNISIRNSDNELFYLYVCDIVENYVSHYIYISPEYYKEIFGKEIKYNSILANGKIDNSIKLGDYDILMINYTDDIVKEFNSFVNGLNKIIIMVVIFASFLAFVVLYNLTIINVSERKREIATFKVLGFYDNEISVYIYREAFILTALGICLGLFLGKYLHRFVINTAETDNVIFLRQIDLTSFLFAVIITLIFSVIVQLIINITLKKINMIDSLKSTE